jgi:DNA invertase Pin-like site-specific DNA recombinase
MKKIEDFEGAAATRAPRPVIYVRSAVNEDGQLQQRLEDARELAYLNGLDVTQDDEITEHGSGAKIEGRPGIQRILAQAARGEISHLVVLQTSHLSRDHHDLHRIFEAMAEAGVTVVTDSEVNVHSLEYKVATAMLAAWR